MNPFIKIAYQPYKWIIVIPFLFINTMILGLICIFTGLPILPITIKNSFHVLPSDTLDITPGNIEIIVHPQVHIPTHHMDGYKINPQDNFQYDLKITPLSSILSIFF
ncbi:MAG: hypothetical protein HOG03_00280 [Desulfobacula sp.]|uniref:hypothetical protein n=1 Tax=Desulfobacula sp. TaxID=2593537 RepID=UPI001DC5E03D|nr:hypothetical protein [Desulfobacula sp.]MBT3483825.1 hypothetical protein [Desulfobacula sp.]MBT3803013.1 hypothetical protein [Desulfobacula sp.]MBT4023474.1 hypothetical protein [Desulfobacula sp.]MBT4197061.1 hypothetical protein [Desulfobacula sp.]